MGKKVSDELVVFREIDGLLRRIFGGNHLEELKELEVDSYADMTCSIGGIRKKKFSLVGIIYGKRYGMEPYI